MCIVRQLAPILLLLAISCQSVRASACTVTTAEGDTFDFGALAAAESRVDVDVGGSALYTYQLVTRFCSTIDAYSDCKYDEAAFCLLRDDDWFLSMARFQSASDVQTATTTETGVKLVFSNLKDSLMGPMELRAELNCAKTASPPVVAHAPGTDPYVVTYVQSHPAACKGGAAGGGGGLSGGSIFLILFFVSAFVYVVAGCVWNVKRNGLSPGPEACPQRAFWASIPGNVAAGVRFTANGCKRKGGYDSSTGEGETAL